MSFMNLPKPDLSRESALKLWFEKHSEYAKEQMVLCNQGMVADVLRKMNLNPFDDDLYSVGMVGLLKAINTFSLDKGFAFSTYAYRCISNEILMTFRKKNVPIAFSLDDNKKLESGEETSYADTIPDKRRFEDEVITGELFHRFTKSLSDRERNIITLYIEERTQQEIAGILNLSQSYVSRILRKCLNNYRIEFCN